MTLTAEQLALRQTGIGASEIAAVAGLDPHRTPLDVWMLKRGLAGPFAGNEFTRWGDRLEAVIAGAYAEARGVLLDTRDTLRHAGEPWMLATPDRVVLDSAGAEERLLQVKNRGLRQADRWGEPGTDQVPDAVAAQCHWEMAVTGLALCDVAVLIAFVEMLLRLNRVVHAPYYALFFVGPAAYMLEIWWTSRQAARADARAEQPEPDMTGEKETDSRSVSHSM